MLYGETFLHRLHSDITLSEGSKIVKIHILSPRTITKNNVVCAVSCSDPTVLWSTVMTVNVEGPSLLCVWGCRSGQLVLHYITKLAEHEKEKVSTQLLLQRSALSSCCDSLSNEAK